MTQTWQMNEGHLQIQLPEIFDFDVILDYLTRDTNECMYSVMDNHVTRLIEINGHRILFRVRAINNEILDIEFLNGTEPNNDLIPDVVVYVRE